MSQNSESSSPSFSDLLDITGANFVEIQVDTNGRTLWVHVDGKTRLRICRIDNIHIFDSRNYSTRKIQEKEWKEIAEQKR